MPKAPADFQPTCRYAHGPLIENDGLWALNGVNMMGMTTGLLNVDKAPVANNKAYVCKVWKCPACGYLELFDYE